ncbi:sugar ABC transporter ATP-binding protein [Paenirhodobacter populi]|uniref:Sugar ABC transporter ATP-binding protein n=1 Tax=Paenirhodobacter populi TaxID=2306993 RepID=A0A443J4B3_9RHOB|nr:sugar ABC transporter ATP-binding protein [Sinirhodobacter populi]RWR15322.1 sugar ABC transporter ATP-binding protein [Sinirhodobacter populi]
MLLEVTDITKSFGPVQALRGVSLALRPGSVHAVLGENGAGKSTLMKVISGVFPPSSGEIRVGGAPVSWHQAEQARAAGVSTIFQEFILLPNLSVAENLFLGREPRNRLGLIDRPRMREESRRILARVGLDLNPDVLTGSLRVAEQQMVEIAKGVMRDARIFVFDEPTAALGDREAAQLFALIRQLRTEGKGVLYISHRLPELFDLCDEVTVLKDGQYAGHFLMKDTGPEELVTTMVGRRLDQLYPQRPAPATGVPLLELRAVKVEGLAGPVNLSVGRNEIVGLAGLEGQGQIEITRAIYEGHTLEAGEILFDGKAFDHSGPTGGIAAGIGLIPEDRKADGLFLPLSVARNISAGLLPGLGLGRSAPQPKAEIEAQVRRLRIRLRDTGQTIGELSGGNQQKALLARWLVRGVRLLICEEPTRGVDIGAKSEIYAILRELADSGVPVLVTSRELPELIGLCDRIVVVRDGATVAEIPGTEATEERIMAAAIRGGQR